MSNRRIFDKEKIILPSAIHQTTSAILRNVIYDKSDTKLARSKFLLFTIHNTRHQSKFHHTYIKPSLWTLDIG